MPPFFIEYTEPGFEKIAPIFLSDEDYSRALQTFVFATTDIVPVEKGGKTIYLAQRKAKPMSGLWWIGGRMQMSETKEEAAVRNFQRETGLVLDPQRFEFVAVVDTRMKDRAHAPQELGCHSLNYTFTVELTPEEIAFVTEHLDENEYHREFGLRPFNRERLVSEGAPSIILEFYDQLFPVK
jgi:ADP-ribose pyrophosphatase YjhB (NUDIX family)